MKKTLLFSIAATLLIGVSTVFAQNCQGQFKTFTIGGWGTVCNGGNPGCYRDAYFESAFPDGLAIGCGSNTLELTSSQAVEDFLPSGGPSVVLSGAIVNPAGTINNTLASQLVAITLAIGFDANDPNFSANASSFASLQIVDGTFAGMTVAQFLQTANEVIGGCSTAYSLAALNSAATAINENYDNGTVDNGYLDCNTLRLYAITVDSNVSCFGYQNGQATVTVTGGNAPYHYALNGQTAIDAESTSYTFTNLSAGNYTVIVTDSNGVVATGNNTFTVIQPTLIQPLTAATSVSCFEGTNGSAAITSISGGVAPYSILWFNGSTENAVSGLSAGTYNATVTDSIGCSVSVSVVVEQPTILGYTASLINVSCNGGVDGSATVTPTGGTAPYTIVWDNNSTSFTRTGMWANSAFTAVITDANGCQTNVSVSVSEPTALAVGTVTTPAVCFQGNGTATATVTGGTAPYTYVWNSTPAQYEATASLPVGSWSVTVTDANGCSIAAVVTISQLSCEGFTTVTMGGYGAACSGGNWGCYLVSNFSSKFPTGLTIGSGSKLLKLTSAAAVKAFLPSGSTARALNAGTLTNPTKKSYNNVLAGQTVALTLSVAFDSNPAFSPSSTPLGSLIVMAGPFTGKTVNQLLTIANTVLGGDTSTYTAAQINTALDAVNRNYDNGTVNLGYLACPCGESSKMATASSAEFSANFVVYPNPVKANSTLEFTLNYDSNVKVVIFNTNGQLVNEVYAGSVSSNVNNTISINATSLKAGVYFLKVTTDKETITKSVLIAE